MSEIKKRFVMGVDPGIKGAISVLDLYSPTLIHGQRSFELIGVWDMPTTTVKVGLSSKNKIDLHKLTLLVGLHAKQTMVAMVEEVGVMSGEEGRVSMFNFGYSAGAIAGIIASSLIPIHMIKPSVWKSDMGLSSNKTESRDMASNLFPSHISQFKRAMDDGRAEAALLAYYAANHILSEIKKEKIS